MTRLFTGQIAGKLVAAVGLATSMAAASVGHAGEVSTAKSVVELFTSQGCSSCPPADAIAGQLAKHNDIVVLSLPVDYWDYLGWKDTFAKHEFSERQRHYSAVRGDGQVYTPQVVVNGLQHAVGSEQDSIDSAIASTSKTLAGKRVPLKLTEDASGGVTIEIGDAPVGLAPAKANIVLAAYKSSAEVNIHRGENGGHAVTYYNIVRDWKSLGNWDGKATTLHVSAADMSTGGADGCAVLLQQGENGAILAAGQYTEKRG